MRESRLPYEPSHARALGLAFGAALALAGCGPAPYLVALLGLSGGGSSSHPFNAPPSVAVVTPNHSQTGGSAAIAFTLSDPEGDPITVSFTYSVDGGPFLPATARPGSIANPIEAPPEGKSYTFVWETGTDLVPNSANVVLAIEATDGHGTTKTVTGAFAVVNDPLAVDASALPPGAGLGLPALPIVEALVPVPSRPGDPPFPSNAGPTAAFDFGPLVRGGLKPYSFSLATTPALAGMTLDPSTGRLAGQPLRGGTYRLTITVKDATPAQATQDFEIDVLRAVRIAAGALPPATPGQTGYDALVPAQGGRPPYTFRLKAGTLPGTLALAGDGHVRGDAPALGPLPSALTAVTVEVSDTLGFSSARTMKLRVAPPRPIAQVVTATPSVASLLGQYVVADVDGDGQDDLVRLGETPGPTTKGSPGPSSGATLALDAFLADGKGGFDFAHPVSLAVAPPAALSEPPQIIATGDWNGDGLPDFAVADLPSSNLFLLTSAAGPSLPSYASSAIAISPGAAGFGVVAGKFVGNGKDQLVFAEVTFGPSGPVTTAYFLDPVTPTPVVAATEPGNPGAVPLVAAAISRGGVAELHFGGRFYKYDATAGNLVLDTATGAFPSPDATAGLFEAAVPLPGDPLGRDVLLRQGSAPPGPGPRALSGPPSAAPPLVVIRFDLGVPTTLSSTVATDAIVAVLPGRATAASLVVSGAPGSLFLATLQPDGTFDLPSFDANHVAQAFTSLPLLGPAHAALSDASDRVVLAAGTTDLNGNPGPDRILLLARDGNRLDGADGRLLPPDSASSAAQRLLPLFDPERASLILERGVITPFLSMFVFASDATGRLGDLQVLAQGQQPDLSNATVPLDVALRRDHGTTGLVLMRGVIRNGVAGGSLELYPYPVTPGALPLANPIASAPATPGNLIAAADLDGSGRDGIVAYERNAGVVSFKVVSSAPFAITKETSLFVGVSFGAMTVADVDQRGFPDVAFDPGHGELIVIRDAGDGTIGGAAFFTIVPGANFNGSEIQLADLDGDGTPDAVVRLDPFGAATESSFLVALNSGGAFGAATTFGTSPSPGPIRVLDLDLDGFLDACTILSVADSSGLVSTFHGDGRGGLVPRAIEDFALFSANQFSAVLIGDLDGDGIDDLVLIGDNGHIATLFGDGHGGFRRADPAPFPP